MRIRLLLCLVSLLAACAPAEPTLTPEVFQVEYSASAKPWLADVYACAAGQDFAILAEQRAEPFFSPEADLTLQFGETSDLPEHVFQIGSEQVAVFVNAKNPQSQLSSSQIRDIFSGRTNDWGWLGGNAGSIQVWVFPDREDLQIVFNQRVLADTPLTSLARMAASTEDMATALSADVNAIGILPLGQAGPGLHAVFSLDPDPVLAVLRNGPDERTAPILACLQK